MGRTTNWDGIPDTGVVPDGIYQVSIADLEETAAKNGKLMYNIRFEVIEPADFAGMGIFEIFVIGSEEDPDATEDATWIKSIGARRLKQALKAAQVPLDNDMDNVIAAAIQQQLVISVTQEVEAEGTYAGRVRNRISAFYQLGHKEVGLTDAPSAKAKPRTVAPAVPRAAMAAPARPAPQLAPAPRPAAPRPNLPPGTQLASAAPKAVAKPAAKAAEVKCTICDSMIARADFAEHVEFHSAEV
jgi:hypothetical protein